MIFSIDKMAAVSPLKPVHPAEKALFSIVSLIMVLFSNGWILPLSVLSVMFFMIIVPGGVSPGRFFKLMLIPAAFILMSLLPIVLRIHTVSFEGSRPLGPGLLYWGSGRSDLLRGGMLFLRSIAGISCFYFLILSTPLGQIDYLLMKLRISSHFREMMMLMYRYIFLLSELAGHIWNSQKMRRGYGGFRRSLKSLGLLCVSVLTKTGTYSDQAGMALEARGCTGDCIEFIQPEYHSSRRNLIGLTGYVLVLAGLRLLEELWPI